MTGLPLALPLILPLHPLDNWLWLHAYVDLIARIVPGVAKFNTIDNSYGQLAATVDALMWPPALAASLYLYPYVLIPLWRAKKDLCTRFFKARLSVGQYQAEVIAIEKGKSPSTMNLQVVSVLFILWVVFSDLRLMPQGAPMFGPIAANGFFIYALKNRFYMSFISWMALITAMSAYAFIPLFLIGQLICRLKRDSTNNRPNLST